MGVPRVDANRGAGPLHAVLSEAAGGSLSAWRGNGNVWPLPVFDVVGKGVVRVGASTRGVGAYSRDAVDVLGFREVWVRRVDSCRVSWAV